MSQYPSTELETNSGNAEGTFQTISKRSSSQAGGVRRGGPRDRSHGSGRGHQNHAPSTDEMVQLTSVPRKRVQSNHKDRDYKPRLPNRSLKDKETSSRASSKGKEFSHTHHHTNRHRNGNDSGGKVGSKVTSSNRFEKLDQDVDCETSMASSASGENLGSKSSPSGSSTSLSNTSSSSSSSKVASEEKKQVKNRSNRSGKLHSRGKSPYKVSQQQDVHGGGSRSNDNSEARQEGEEDVEEGQGGGEEVKWNADTRPQKKRSPKQIKFDLPPETGGKSNSHEDGDDDKIKLEDASLTKGAPSNDVGLAEETALNEHAELYEPVVVQSKKESSRIIYERESLLAMRDLPLSRDMPSNLTRRDLNLFSQAPVLSSHQLHAAPPASEEDLVGAQSDTNKDSFTAEGKPKYPTALNLVREHDKLGKVCLSPQRRSFQRGCSWKDKILTTPNPDGSQHTPPDTAASLKTPPLKNEVHFKFDEQKVQPRQYSQGHPPSPTPHNPPRVIHHIPLYNQEHREEKHSKKGWRHPADRDRPSKERYASREPEPEWMEFGPTDRYDVIELKGFDEHEIERDAMKDSDSGLEESGSKESLYKSQDDHSLKRHSSGFPANNEEDDPYNEFEGDGYKDGGLHVDGKHKPRQGNLALMEQEDNEFILDGFDFSTGVSICQELALDEEEGCVVSAGRPMLFSREDVKDPSQLGNVLMKALGVGKEKVPSPPDTKGEHHQHTISSSSSTGVPTATMISPGVPPNALTLDEIHARENIQPPPRPTTPTTLTASTTTSTTTPSSSQGPSEGEGMGAFNKLLAAMKSKQQNTTRKPSQPEELAYQKFSNPPAHASNITTPTTNSPRMRMLSNSERITKQQQQQLQQQHQQFQQQQQQHHQQQEGTSDYGYLLEMELLDLDEDPSVPAPFPEISDHLNAGEPNLVRLEKLGRMLDRMNRDPLATPIQPYSNMGPPPAPHPPPSHLPHHVRQMEAMHPPPPPLDRGDGRGWMYPDRSHNMRQQVDRTQQPTQQQLMAARQHQMLTTRNANNWAVEMERRRVMELQQMQMNNPPHHHHHHHSMKGGTASSSKPNISLLPTSVMRQIHNAKSPGQPPPAGELPKNSSLGNRRMDHDMTNKPSQSHSVLLNHDTDFSGPGDYSVQQQPHPHGKPTGMRMGHPPGHTPQKMADLSSAGAMYPHYNVPMSHGMQVQNPYGMY